MILRVLLVVDRPPTTVDLLCGNSATCCIAPDGRVLSRGLSAWRKVRAFSTLGAIHVAKGSQVCVPKERPDNQVSGS